jgi:citrate lyase gamma subunit
VKLTVIWAPRAAKDLGALDGLVQSRIGNAVQRYAETG